MTKEEKKLPTAANQRGLSGHAPDSVEHTVDGLLRIIGWLDGNDRKLTEEEAEGVFDAVEAEPIAEEQMERLRAGILRRRFGNTPAKDQDEQPAAEQHFDRDAEPVVADDRARSTPTSGATSDALPYDRPPTAAESPVLAEGARGVRPAAREARVRPSLLRHCSTLKRKLGEFANELHLDQQTLFELDRGAARNVPAALVDAAAITLRLERSEVARCLAPAGTDIVRMAAHGRRGAQASKPAPLRDFIEVIDASALPEQEKRYWHSVVAAERAAATRTSENA